MSKQTTCEVVVTSDVDGASRHRFYLSVYSGNKLVKGPLSFGLRDDAVEAAQAEPLNRQRAYGSVLLKVLC